MSNEIVIKIGSPLLMELIGGDAHVELRKGIVENFARNHLKSLINDEQMEERIDRVEKEILDMVRYELKTAYMERVPDNYSSDLMLTKEFRKQLATRIRVEAKDFAIDEMKKVKDYFNQKIKDLKEHYDKEVPLAVNRLINQDFEQRVQDEINRRVALLKGDSDDEK